MAQAYNYRANICEDIKNYIEENSIKVTAENKDDLYQELYDDLFISDSVTGNASGSYTFNAWIAEENICHNLDLLGEALNEFGCDATYILERGAESCDVTIRCYLLGECLQEVLDELEEEEEEETEEDCIGFFFVWEDKDRNELQRKWYPFDNIQEAIEHRNKLFAECNISDCVKITIY